MAFQFSISFSVENYKHKPTEAEIKKMMFHRQENVTVELLAEKLKQGHSICGCFNTPKETFKLSDKKESNFAFSNWIWVDIDDSLISMTDFLGKLSQLPTIAYTTASNGKNGKFRFRLGYLFGEAITSVSVYKQTYTGVTDSIMRSIPDFIIKDNCGRSPAQMLHGNGTGNCNLIVYESNLYRILDFPSETPNAQSREPNESCRVRQMPPITDEQFMSDFKSKKFFDLIDSYRKKYPFFDRTELHYENGYALIPNDYIEIHRKWYMDFIKKSDGSEYRVFLTKKLNDGDHRRKNLFIGGLIRKKIKPDITYEHLLLNLVCECEWFCRNTDGVLTRNVLMDIAINVINTPLDKITISSSKKKKRFEVSKEYCREHGISPKAMSNRVRHILKDKEIGECLDLSLTVMQNLKRLNEMGVKVGKNRLYAFYKEHGIPTKPAKT